MALARRDKGHHRRDFNRTNFQIEEDVSQSGAKRPTLWKIPKDERN